MTALVSPAIPRWQSEVPGDAQFETVRLRNSCLSCGSLIHAPEKYLDHCPFGVYVDVCEAYAFLKDNFRTETATQLNLVEVLAIAIVTTIACVDRFERLTQHDLCMVRHSLNTMVLDIWGRPSMKFQQSQFLKSSPLLDYCGSALSLGPSP